MSQAPTQPDALAAGLLRAFDVLEKLQASNDLGEVLELVINAMQETLRADRASVFQYDEQTGELFMSRGHGGAEIRFPITKGIAGEVARTKLILNIRDCYADARFNPEVDRKTGYRTRNMLTIPLLSSGGCLEGVAQVLNKDDSLGQAFDEDDEKVARALSTQAAIALRRAKLLLAEARKNKIEHDLSIARKIQQAGLPKSLPRIQGYDLAAFSEPAEETGGDAYDLFQPGVTDPESEAALIAPLLFALGDATGHGIGPALSAAQFRAMFRMGSRLDADLPLIASQINAQLCNDLPTGRFVTAFMACLDPLSHTIDYVAAGQAPIILVRADGTEDIRDASAMPLGLDTDFSIDKVEPFKLAPGDAFLLISDGYYEAQNHHNQHFGQDRVIASVRDCGLAATAEELLERIRRDSTKFADGRPFDDDQTAIIVKRMPE